MHAQVLTEEYSESMFSNLYQELLEGKTALSLVGLGYVGMPIAVAFAKK